MNRTRVGASASRSRRSTSRPSMPGIRTSSTVTSGRCSRICLQRLGPALRRRQQLEFRAVLHRAAQRAQEQRVVVGDNHRHRWTRQMVRRYPRSPRRCPTGLPRLYSLTHTSQTLTGCKRQSTVFARNRLSTRHAPPVTVTIASARRATSEIVSGTDHGVTVAGRGSAEQSRDLGRRPLRPAARSAHPRPAARSRTRARAPGHPLSLAGRQSGHALAPAVGQPDPPERDRARSAAAARDPPRAVSPRPRSPRR